VSKRALVGAGLEIALSSRPSLRHPYRRLDVQGRSGKEGSYLVRCCMKKDVY